MCEFFTFENEVWFRLPNGSSDRLTEKHTDIISSALAKIERFYPKAYHALCKEYERCKQNLSFFNFEYVSCPLRGECKYEHIICHPDFDHHISDAEMRVLRLWYHGKKKDAIAEELYLSVHTINNHIRNAFTRLGIHEKAEFVKYVEFNNLFQ